MNKASIEQRRKTLTKLLSELKKEDVRENAGISLSLTSSINRDVDFVSEKEFLEVKAKLDQIPESNGVQYYQPLNTTIGFMTDVSTYRYYQHVATSSILIDAENYLVEIDEIDVLMIYMTREYYKTDIKHMKKVVEKYKEENIPVIMFLSFNADKDGKTKELVKEADYVFSTSLNRVNQYNKQLERTTVYHLSEGFDPNRFNPIGLNKMAGDNILHIFDKNNKELTQYVSYSANNGAKVDFFLKPSNIEKLTEDESENLFYDALYPLLETSIFNKINKLYKYSLFINTKKWSITGLDKGLYESLASGNIVLSNFSLEASNHYPIVMHVFSEEDYKNMIYNYSPEEVNRLQLAGIRKVYRNQTSYSMFTGMFEKAGIKTPNINKSILVVGDTLNPKVVDMFEQQTYQWKELINISEAAQDTLKQYDYVTFFSENDLYEEYYLEDMINAFKYTSSDFVTKDSYKKGNTKVFGKEHDYVDQYDSKFRTVFSTNEFHDLSAIKESGVGNGFSADSLEYVSDYMPPIQTPANYKISVLVPIYNNGELLIDRGFNSLIRSTMFNDLEIILVDDGSTDGFTQKMVTRLARKYSNVKSFLYNDGGSGSASRPKNKGLEMATTDYVVIFDPDDEIKANAYETLYKEAELGNYDIVFGKRPAFGEKYSIVNNYKNFVDTNDGLMVSHNPREWLIRANFKHINNQVMIIRKDIITNNHLSFIEGAVSQDVVFGNLLFLVADKVKAIDEDIYIYYSGISGSITNSTHSIKYFEKLLSLEKNRVQWLKTFDVFDIYCANRIEYIFNNHFKKLANVNKSDVIKAIEILYEIYKMYLPNIHFESPKLQKFVDLAYEGNMKQIYEKLVTVNKK
jgi:glycosyltransferase involved in cell wall biosynthesis